MNVVKLHPKGGGPSARSPLHERIANLARQVDAEPKSIGVLSTGEACAVALLLGRTDFLSARGWHPLDALERLGPDWERAVRDLHRDGW